MNAWKQFKSGSWGGRWFVRLIALLLVTGLIFTQVPGPVSAMRPVPGEGEDESRHTVRIF